MAKLNWLYEDSYRGIKYVAQTDQAQLRTMGTGSGSVYNCDPGYWVELTGYYCWYEGYPDYIYFQTTFGDWFVVGDKEAWKAYSRNASIPHYSRDQVQAMVDAMLKNDKRIVENNLFCARYADKLTAEQKKAVVQLQRRVQERQEALKSEGYVTDIQTAKPEGYAEFEPYLNQLMNSGIGIATWAVLLIYCFVIGSLAGAAYFVYRDFFAQAKEDVKWSDELTATLKAKLTEEEYAQLEKETQGIVTKATIRSRFAGIGKGLLYGGILLGGALLYRLISDRK